MILNKLLVICMGLVFMHMSLAMTNEYGDDYSEKNIQQNNVTRDRQSFYIINLPIDVILEIFERFNLEGKVDTIKKLRLVDKKYRFELDAIYPLVVKIDYDNIPKNIDIIRRYFKDIKDYKKEHNSLNYDSSQFYIEILPSNKHRLSEQIKKFCQFPTLNKTKSKLSNLYLLEDSINNSEFNINDSIKIMIKLNLSNMKLETKDIIELSKLKIFNNITEINLINNEINILGAIVLVNSKMSENLISLDLRENQIPFVFETDLKSVIRYPEKLNNILLGSIFINNNSEDYVMDKAEDVSNWWVILINQLTNSCSSGIPFNM